MKIWTSQHVFDHSWDMVVQAALRKYPNPHNPSVTGIDTFDRRVTKDGVLKSNRLFRGDWSIPSWATALIGLDNPTYAYEYSEVNPRNKEMSLRTVNLNCLNYMNVEETLVYKQHPDNPQKTLLEQSTVITVQGVPLVSYLEGFLASIFRANTSKGRQAMEWVIGNMRREYEELSMKMASEYEELSNKLSSEYDGLSQKLASEYDNILRRESEQLLLHQQTNTPTSHPRRL